MCRFTIRYQAPVDAGARCQKLFAPPANILTPIAQLNRPLVTQWTASYIKLHQMDLYMYISMYFGWGLFVRSERQKCRRSFTTVKQLAMLPMLPFANDFKANGI
jgi:hypothetical protein